MQLRHTFAILAALALLTPGLPAIAASDPYQATITKVVRQVDWERYRTTVWQKADVGNLLLVGDTLRTGADAKAELRYGDDSLTRVGSLSSLTLTGDGRREIHLDAGRIWLHVTKHSVGMKVITPGAVAAITGTELMVDFDPTTRLTQVTVFEGSVNVTSDVGNLVRVLGGTSTLVPFRAPAAAPMPIQPAQFQERAKIFKPLSLPSSGNQSTGQATQSQPQNGNPQSSTQGSANSTDNSGSTKGPQSGTSSKGSDKGQQTGNQSSSAQSGTKSSDNSASTKSTGTDKSQPSDSDKGGDKTSSQPDDKQAATTNQQPTDPTQTTTQPQPQPTDAPQPDTKAADTPAHQDEVKPDLQGQTDTLMDPRVLNGSPTTGEVKVIVK